MRENRIDAVRSWAQQNEPLLRLAEVAIVVLFGCFLTGYIAWQQYRLTDIQVRVAQAQVEPSLEVSYWSSSPGPPAERDIAAIQVYYHRKDVHDLEGHPIFFLQETGKDGKAKRIAIFDFYEHIPTAQWPEAMRGGYEPGRPVRVLNFTSSCRADSLAHVKFLCDPSAASPDEFFAAWSNDIPRRAFCFARIEYRNAIEDKITDTVLIEYPRLLHKRIDEEPSYNCIIRLADFPGKDGPDFNAVVAKVNALFAGE
jgi:hypothetical protein